jgi:hypothetical protein
VNSYRGFTSAQRLRALRWIQRERAAGRRTAPTVCMTCGQTEGLIVGHSEDYSEPFGDHIGAWELCWLCHMMVHMRQKAPASWERYRAALVDGYRFGRWNAAGVPGPFTKPDWWGFRRWYLAAWEPVVLGRYIGRSDTLSLLGGPRTGP